MPHHKMSLKERKNSAGEYEFAVICSVCGVIDTTENKYHAQMLVGKHHRQFNE